MSYRRRVKADQLAKVGFWICGGTTQYTVEQVSVPGLLLHPPPSWRHKWSVRETGCAQWSSRLTWHNMTSSQLQNQNSIQHLVTLRLFTNRLIVTSVTVSIVSRNLWRVTPSGWSRDMSHTMLLLRRTSSDKTMSNARRTRYLFREFLLKRRICCYQRTGLKTPAQAVLIPVIVGNSPRHPTVPGIQ